jgi:D-glycero-D-manno-heptose 1,7-bisphosphate phosphatase
VLNAVRMVDGVASTPRSVEELDIEPGALTQLERLKARGFVLIVVSNQPDVARGDLAIETVMRINDELCRVLPVDAVYFCPHDTRDGCSCRKPKPGLIQMGAEAWDVDLGRSALIGDRWVDIAAAGAAGIDGILLRRTWSWEPTSLGSPPSTLVPAFESEAFSACVEFMLQSGRYGQRQPPVQAPSRDG